MTWASGEVLFWLWGLPLLAMLLWLSLRARHRAMARLGALLSVRRSIHTAKIHRYRAVLLVLAVGLCVAALAQPRWGYRWQEQRSEGVSMVVILDVSRSMDAEDVSPSRMERARREVRDLAGMMAGDRVALVLAAGGAHPQMFLTLDYDTFEHMARQASTTTLRAQGSDLGAAIDKGVELLAGSEGDRAILLISDGEDQLGEAEAAATRAAEADIRLFSLGVGTTEGAPIPLAGGGFQKDGGEVVITRLDEDTLRDIAEAGAGAYVRSVAGASDIRAIYLDEIRGKMSGAEQGVRREKIWTERYQWFLAAALFLLLIGHALRPGALRLRGTGLALLLLTLPGAARADGTEIDALIQQQISRPDDLALAERLGAALLKEGRFDEASDVLDGIADRSLDPEQRGRARYNAGLAEYGAGRLTAAVEDWQRVLTDAPEHAAAKQNAASVQAEISARMEEEPPEDSQDGESQDGEPQDGEPQDSEPQDSESQDSESQDSESQDGEPSTPPDSDGTTAPDDGQEAPAEDTGQPAEPVAAGEPGEPEDGEGAAAQAGEAEAGEVSEDAAMRLLNSVEEGEPRVEITPESRGGKDW